MREIKFRAWDRFEGMRMLFGIDKYSIYIEQEKEIYGMGPTTSRQSRTKDIKIMQYTGLKDKNGVEIYEGDIIKTPNSDWGIVVYRTHGFELTVSETDTSFYLAEFYENSEVIGNIYENQELLS